MDKCRAYLFIKDIVQKADISETKKKLNGNRNKF